MQPPRHQHLRRAAPTQLVEKNSHALQHSFQESASLVDTSLQICADVAGDKSVAWTITRKKQVRNRRDIERDKVQQQHIIVDAFAKTLIASRQNMHRTPPWWRPKAPAPYRAAAAQRPDALRRRGDGACGTAAPPWSMASRPWELHGGTQQRGNATSQSHGGMNERSSIAVLNTSYLVIYL